MSHPFSSSQDLPSSNNPTLSGGPRSTRQPPRRGLTPLATSTHTHQRPPSATDSPSRAGAFSPTRSDYINLPPSVARQVTSRPSSSSSNHSFTSSAGANFQQQHHVPTAFSVGARARTLTSSSNSRLASPIATISAASQGVGNAVGAAGSASRLARHSPSHSLSTTGSPVSAGGASGQLTSLVITQLNILLSTIKEDGDSAKWQVQAEKIQRLVHENGMEVYPQYFRRLLQSNAAAIFSANARQTDHATAGNYQLLVKEMQKILQEPQQADKIAESLDTSESDLFKDFDLSTFIDHFKLDSIAKVALVLPIRKASKPDLRSKADAILTSNFQNFLSALSLANNPDPQDELPAPVLASLIDRLIQEPPRNWSEEQRVDLFYAIRVRYSRLNARIPTAVESAMFLIELLDSQDGRLARHVQRAGPKGTASLEACKDMLGSVETRDISYPQIANALLFMAIAQNGEAYDASIFVGGLRQHRAGPGIDWTDVVQGFDKDGLKVTKKQFVALYSALLPLAKEYSNFDIQSLWGGAWQYPDTQLSFVVAFLSTTQEELDVTQIPNLRQAFTLEDFEDASDTARAFAESAVRHPLASKDATEALFTMIFRSQETYNHAQMLGIPDTLINPNMTVFVVAASAVPKPWAALQEQALKQLFYPFLLKQHDNYDFVMHALWKHDRMWIAGRMVEFFTQENMLLILIFEHARDHGWLNALLTIQSSFAVDLATYAHGKDVCDLDEWAQMHVSSMGPPSFARAIVDFLRTKMEDEANVQKERAPPTTTSLTVKTVHKLLVMINDALPDEELGPVQRQALQVYPRLINYGEGEKYDASIDASSERGHSLPDQASLRMEDQYKRMYGGGIDANDIIEELKKLKKSANPGDQDLFAAMIHGLFDEYNCFGEYPNEALATTAVLFGGLIKYDVLSGLSVQVALFMVFEAVTLYGPEDSMWKFGMQALIHFIDRLKDWPHLAERILLIPSLRGTQVVPAAEKILKDMQVDNVSANGDGANGLINGAIDEEFPAEAPIPLFQSIRIDAPLRPELYEQPDEEVSDKVIFVLNNMSKRNIEEKSRDLQSALEDRHHQWFAHYLVEELAKSQPNNKALYLQLLERFNQKVLWAEVLRETYISCAKMLNAPSTMDSSHERGSLKNLAGWLGSLTLARDQPVLHRNISFKDLLLEAYDTQRFLVVVPFTCKVLIQAAQSKIFKPPNPWLMELLGFLSELYHFMELKLNLKFEIEVLCKELNLDIHKVEPLDVIRSRPLLHESNMLQQYVPDGGPDGFSDMHLMGLSKRPASERFTPEAVIAALPDLGNMLQIPQAAGNVTQLQLRTIFINAAQQAIYEIIAPVVERSVTIAAISTQELVQKDFAVESDVDKMRNAAHTVVKSLSGSLALVTCKEPLRMSIMNNIRIMASRNLPDQLPEGQILMFVNDNIDTVCSLVERAAEEHSLAEVDLQLANAVDQRRQHNEQRPSEPFNNPQISRWAQLIPDPYRQELGGLNRQQLALYEDFGRQARITPTTHAANASVDASRQLPDVLSDSYLPNLPTPAEAPAMPQATPQQQRMQAMQGPQNQHQVNGYDPNANIGQAIRGLLDALQHACRDSSEEHIADIGENSAIRRTYEELVAIIDTSVQKDQLALAAGQETIMRVYADAQKRLEIEVLVRFLTQLCRMSPTALRGLTSWLALFDDDRMFNSAATVALLSEHLLDIEHVDAHASRALKMRRPAVLGFLKELIDEILLSDSPIGALRADFVLSYEALAQWLADEPSLEHGRDIMTMLQLPANQTNGMPSPPESGRQDQLEYVFEEWLRVQRKDAPERSQVAFLKQLHDLHIVGNADQSSAFFRACLDMCVTVHERAASSPYTSYEPVHVLADALAKLISLLVVYQDPAEEEEHQRAIKFLDAAMHAILLIFTDHYKRQREQFAGRMFFRLLSSLLAEFNALRESNGEEIHGAILKKFALAFRVLQPLHFEGFCCSWLSLISHRLFLPHLLKGVGRSTGGWDVALQLFGDMFSFLGRAMAQADASLTMREFYQGICRIMLMLHRDFPEFLIENHAFLNGIIPEAMSQLHNLINSAAPLSVVNEQPDPFQSGLKINRLDLGRQQPVVYPDLEKVFVQVGIMDNIRRALAQSSPTSDDVPAIVRSVQRPDGNVDSLLVNYLVLYIAQKATEGSPVFSAGAAPARLIERLLNDSKPEISYQVLSALTNQLRYVNSHTQYCTTALTHMFSVGSDYLQQQMMTVFVNRLHIARPHPWGLIITVLELIKNSNYDIWALPWIKTQPTVEQMLTHLVAHQTRVSEGHSPSHH